MLTGAIGALAIGLQLLSWAVDWPHVSPGTRLAVNLAFWAGWLAMLLGRFLDHARG